VVKKRSVNCVIGSVEVGADEGNHQAHVAVRSKRTTLGWDSMASINVVQELRMLTDPLELKNKSRD
jgi:hypothetical protein